MAIVSKMAVFKVVGALFFADFLWASTICGGLVVGAISAMVRSRPQHQRRQSIQSKIVPMANDELGTNAQKPLHTLIVGAGFAGIGLAARMLKYGLNDVRIVERNAELGGTWYENHYPGAACDIPSALYSFSFALNPNWSHFFGRQPEILQYLKDVAQQFKIMPLIKFNTNVCGAYWQEEEKVWRIDTKEGESIYARYLVNAQGPLSDPNPLRVPGIEKFKGIIFHTQKWPRDIDLSGKRVMVVGTGASAVQLCPAIQPLVSKLYISQRTPNWVVPRNDYVVHKWVKFVFKLFPWLMKLQRWALYWAREGNIFAFKYNLFTHHVFRYLARASLYMQVKDPVLREKVTPKYEIGCKRVLISNDWYNTLQMPNVELITSAVETVTENGVCCANDRVIDVDIIITATGFEVQRLDVNSGFPIVGRGGISLFEFWAKNNGMKAYKCTTVPMFPNAILSLGPGSGLGHNSIITQIESQNRYIVELMLTADDCNARTVEVRRSAYDRWNEWLALQTRGTVWLRGGCHSWYLSAADNEKVKKGVNPNDSIVLWPTFCFLFRSLLLNFDAEQYMLS